MLHAVDIGTSRARRRVGSLDVGVAVNGACRPDAFWQQRHERTKIKASVVMVSSVLLRNLLDMFSMGYLVFTFEKFRDVLQESRLTCLVLHKLSCRSIAGSAIARITYISNFTIPFDYAIYSKPVTAYAA